MASNDIFNNAKKIYNDHFLSLDFAQIRASANQRNLKPWNQIDFDDLDASVKVIKDTYDTLFDDDFELEPLPYNTVANLQNGLQGIVNHCNNFMKAPDQSKLNQVHSQVQAHHHNLRAFGIIQAIQLDPEMSAINSRTKEQLEFLEAGQSRFIELEKNLKVLAEKGISGSLAQSFSKRQDQLEKLRNIWGALIFITAFATAGTLYFFETQILNTSNDEVKIGLSTKIDGEITVDSKGKVTMTKPVSLKDSGQVKVIQKANSKEQKQESIHSILNIWFLRIAGLGPLLYLFIFSINQYKKERNLIEEYAHRKAVANSLPIYKDLVSDPANKDSISSLAAEIIFSLPSITNSDSAVKKSFNHVKEVAEIVNKVKNAPS